MRLQRIAAVAHEHRRPARCRARDPCRRCRGAARSRRARAATSRTRTGTPLVSATTTSPMSRSDLMRPTPRTLNDCSPSVMRWPPTFWLALASAVDELLERQVLPLELIGVDLDVVLLGVAAEADDVDDARAPGGTASRGSSPAAVLRSVKRVALADDAVAEDLADGAPRRELRLHPRRQLDELQAVDDPLPRVVVIDVPREVALHVGQAEERLRADVVEVRSCPTGRPRAASSRSARPPRRSSRSAG